MGRYALRTHLIENPDIALYYKGKEGTTALDVVVSFSIEDAHVMDSPEACRTRLDLNADADLLQGNGYSQFEMVQL